MTYEELHKAKPQLEIVPFEGNVNDADFISVICPTHGEYKIKAKSIIEGKHSCKKCVMMQNGKNRKLPVSAFTTSFNERFGDKIMFFENSYNGTQLPAKFQCKECGHVFYRRPNNFIYGYRHGECPNCTKMEISKRRTKTTEQFIQEAISIWGEDKFDFSETIYTRSNEKVKIKCLECGNTFVIEANSFLSGKHGCPNHHVLSRLESEMSRFLDKNGIKFIPQAKFDWLGKKSLDFYLPDYNVAIECQGAQHFDQGDKNTKKWFDGNDNQEDINQHIKNNIENDQQKLKECNENGVQLLYFSNLGITYPYKVYEDKTELLKEIIYK